MTRNRESWLHAAVEAFRPWFKSYGIPLPTHTHVSVSFPSTRALSVRKRRIGECWPLTASEDGKAHVMISPLLKDGNQVLDVLLHELIHVVLPGHGHDATFATMAKDFGLEGAPTATVAGPHLLTALRRIHRTLGKYPHGAIKLAYLIGKKQSTRMLKVSCEDCGYIARVSSYWIESAGAPKCPSGHGSMRADQKRVHWKGHKGRKQ